MSKIFVNYFIQNDKWDNIKEPNLYVLPKSYAKIDDILVKDIYDSFPIKRQSFYFRFFLDDTKQGM